MSSSEYSSPIEVRSNCWICGEHSLQIVKVELGNNFMQCISCGYSTAEKFKLNGKLDDNDEYLKLTDDMKKWVKVENNSIWIPGVITLPDAMLFPVNINEKMKWSVAKKMSIPEEERKDYPIEGRDGEFHTNRYETDDDKVFDEFYIGLTYITTLREEKVKELRSPVKKTKYKINLPKLKVDG
jgi:transcription elongation factor Elf1